MTDLADRLDRYLDLSPAERAAVDAAIAGRPDLAHLHRQSRRLAALVDALAAPLTADEVARTAIAHRMGLGRDDPAGWDAERQRIEARLDQFETEAEDPVARFERLTARAFRDSRPASPRSERPPSERTVRLFESAPVVERRALPWVLGAAALAVLWGALWALSARDVTVRQQVAGLGAVEDQVPPGAGSAVAALAEIRAARRTTLGLWPRYDPALLDAAADALAAVADTAATASWASQEARLALGRVHLYRGRDVEAARVLGGLVRDGHYRAAHARRLLDAVRAGAAPSLPTHPA